ncbi:ADP-ribosylglycohydrolase family protein [Fulvivirgaceae bacterium BMA10]|uniref:ADP-ribosylglycohydrolase family protein n=1 Tax=Splendidivirga corallicola TaxID=3051826 RepID=A0ABT8KYN6_9BACT|nr:ADP-ribosylglycohydrolase family protein [Fulvivirgaceae bacterium BMA10]
MLTQIIFWLISLLCGKPEVNIVPSGQPTREDKIKGLIVGSVIGDAAGGPVEFVFPVEQSRWTARELRLDGRGVLDLSTRFKLRPYFKEAAPYAQWRDNAPSGTITDDTRFKVIFFNALENQPTLDASSFAREILTFEQQFSQEEYVLCREWLKEFKYAAQWQLGRPETEGGLPPDRMWAGRPSMAGQMPFLPVAALRPNDPLWCYKKTWELDFFDTGVSKDIHAAVVAGLSEALSEGADWESIEETMRNTDPYHFEGAKYSRRMLNTWLDFAHDAVRRANGKPKILFEILEQELKAEKWWECWVPVVVVFSCAEMAQYHPIASMQLVLEFGHDSDSYAQLMGAFMGALHGQQVFDPVMVQTVKDRLYKDYHQSMDDWLILLKESTCKY